MRLPQSSGMRRSNGQGSLGCAYGVAVVAAFMFQWLKPHLVLLVHGYMVTAEDMGQVSRGTQPKDRFIESAGESGPTLQWVRPGSQSEPLPGRHMHLQTAKTRI